MRAGIIINPISGRAGSRAGTGATRLALARRLAADAGIEVEAEVTRAKGHAGELSRAFAQRGFDLVIAWGGDGTVNEVAGPLIESSSALGVVPSGSGDGFARSLGLPLQPLAALKTALSGSASPIDVGYLGTRHFLNLCGIGFDAAVGIAFDRRKKRGALGYLIGSFTIVWKYEQQPYRVLLDEQAVLEGARFLVAFANCREYGNRMTLAPEADPRDGWLDAVVVDAGSPFRQIWRARRLMLAPHRGARGVFRTRVRSATVSGERLICHVDGEAFETSGTVEVRLVPGALSVVSGQT